ncbi:MAG: IS1595 family transposase [Atopobiaceae bacterium]|nr:IS1595 family transposase [Atopobiaceae bacterium]
MLDMILQEAEGLTLCERRRLIEMLKASVLAELAGPAGEPSECPRCRHDRVVRKGRDRDGSQRWLCRGCGRTFSRKTMGLLALSKLEAWQWSRFVELEARHASLAECASRLGVSGQTAHYMRIRLCEVMASRLPAFRSGEGVEVQVDGTYLSESLKGLGRWSGEMPRESHRTGHDVHVRGISNLKVCVVCGANDLGDEFCRLAARGAATCGDVASALAGRVSEGTVVVTDDRSCYARPLSDARAAHRVVPAKSDALGRVDALHSRLDAFLEPFRGVSTRWLPWYLSWFLWEEHVRRSGLDRAEEMAAASASGAYELTRRRHEEAGRPLWDYWEGRSPTVDPVAEYGPQAA